MDEELKEIVYEITMDDLSYGSPEKKLEYYKSKYPAISEKYKILFQKVCEPEFDVDKFIWMMQMKSRIDDNNITPHNANVEVGKALVDEYVAPKLNK